MRLNLLINGIEKCRKPTKNYYPSPRFCISTVTFCCLSTFFFHFSTPFLPLSTDFIHPKLKALVLECPIPKLLLDEYEDVKRNISKVSKRSQGAEYFL